MKTLLLVLSVLFAVASCDKRDDAMVSQPASSPAPVSPPAPPPVVAPSPEPSLEPNPLPAQTSAPPEATPVAETVDVQVYKCKTEQGVTFSDAPCGSNQEQVSVRETSVIDNAGLREKAEQWKQQDAEAAANQAAERAAGLQKESVANRCFDANGNEIACGYTGGEAGEYAPPWYGDPYYDPYDDHHHGHHHRKHDDNRRASEDDRYDARDRIIDSRFQDPQRAIKQRLGTDGQ